MRIPCTIEWQGHKTGWHGTAEYRGKSITVTQQKSYAAARRRLRATLRSVGAPDVELQITARMPKAIDADMARYKELAKLLPEIESELEDLKMKLAQRLCTELNFSEREAALLLGVSGAHISAKLRAATIDSGEFKRPTREDDDESPRSASAKSR